MFRVDTTANCDVGRRLYRNDGARHRTGRRDHGGRLDGRRHRRRPAGAQPQLAVDPAQLAHDLVADERALRDPSTPEAVLVAAARRQQAAYRAIGRHDDRNVDARQQVTAMAHVKDTMPAWRINAPTPSEELLSDYREAESASGVGWNYLAANGFANDRDHTIYRYKTPTNTCRRSTTTQQCRRPTPQRSAALLPLGRLLLNRL